MGMDKAKHDDGSKPCLTCRGYTKIKLPTGQWICLKTVLTGAVHA